MTKALQKRYKRILEISEDKKMLTFHDNRFYKRNNEFYPSVTSILQMFPKGEHFETWLKKVGFSADYLVKKAAEEGTLVHDLAERYLKREELSYLYEDGNPRYSHSVWEMFLKFIDFWETYNPTLIETEIHLFSDELKVAGTCDLIVEIDGELWILDLKTSNHISLTYEIQTAIYGKCYEECFGKKVKNYGVLWLKSSKRKANKDKMCGKGWEIIQPVRTYEENIEMFKKLQDIWSIVNPKPTPNSSDFKLTVKRNI